MPEDDPLLYSQLDEPFRVAHRALRALVPPGTVTAEDDEQLAVIIEDLEDLVRLARDTAATHLGPTHRWMAPRSAGKDWGHVTLQLDFDQYVDDDPPKASHIHWEGSALALAGRAYARECRWDFSPDESGIWLLSVAPYASIGLGDQTNWSGIVSGFVVLQDRDVDGEYESLAHVWTAREWRRRGVGTSLVRQALERFPVRQVEGPATEKGQRLLERCAPHLL